MARCLARPGNINLEAHDAFHANIKISEIINLPHLHCHTLLTTSNRFYAVQTNDVVPNAYYF
jgi:hypothetical protein